MKGLSSMAGFHEKTNAKRKTIMSASVAIIAISAGCCINSALNIDKYPENLWNNRQISAN